MRKMLRLPSRLLARLGNAPCARIADAPPKLFRDPDLRRLPPGARWHTGERALVGLCPPSPRDVPTGAGPVLRDRRVRHKDATAPLPRAIVRRRLPSRRRSR
ncbi:MAG: hypothetical protein [Microviridae sp.]|nr:MAG: hypothetical protein [Microviridae sp.]